MSRTITFQPSPEQGAFIESMIDNGDYASQSEVVRDGLRLLQEQQAASKLEALRSLIDEAEASPEVKDWDIKEFLVRAKKLSMVD